MLVRNSRFRLRSTSRETNYTDEFIFLDTSSLLHFNNCRIRRETGKFQSQRQFNCGWKIEARLILAVANSEIMSNSPKFRSLWKIRMIEGIAVEYQ